MVLEFFFGVALLVIVAFVLFRIVGSIAIGALLVIVVFLASYLLVGSFPSMSDIPLVGKFIPTTGKTIAVIKDSAYNMDIIGVYTGSNGNLLATVVNTGQLELSNFTAYIDNEQVNILNNKDSIKSGNVIVFELDWKEEFNKLEIKSDQTQAGYGK